ncbi:MAG: hypothetical protein FJ087_01575 [Deltaproteobacteria bacterium]|nr:hypothetical protein [Deltaproteobacteria bacterium]
MPKKGVTVGAPATSEPSVETRLRIEELFEKHGVRAWQRAGVKTHYGWAAGKLLTEEEFLGKLRAWLKGPQAG